MTSVFVAVKLMKKVI